ncbi:MAG: response regulator [Alphaproteobacteria bacterium]|nr:MAG: response regulator [Alphaproteobacteria bacterium]
MTRSVLVVEDEPVIAWLVEEALRCQGYDVLSFGTADAAVDCLSDLHYWCHVLVTDVRLPGELNGWSLARFARERFPSLQVIYLTGDSMLSWSAEKVDNSLIFQKPFVVSSLVAAVGRFPLREQDLETATQNHLLHDTRNETSQYRAQPGDYN